MTEVNNTVDLYADYLSSDEVQDLTKEKGFERREIPKGGTIGRLIEYVELGKRKQKPFKGQEKPDCLMARVTFELLGKRNIREVGEGDTARSIADTISITVPVKAGSRAKMGKLLKKLAYERAKVHPAQCVGDAYRITIVHRTVEAQGDKPARTYANITDDDGNFLIEPPVLRLIDPDTGEETGEKPIKVPQALSPLRVFLWDMPLEQAWDALFIDGTREKTVKGADGEESTIQVSKNWLQEEILKATDFSGSKLEAMLRKRGDCTGMALDDGLYEDEPAPATTPAKGTKKATSAPKKEADVATDPLDDLNLGDVPLDDDIPY